MPENEMVMEFVVMIFLFMDLLLQNNVPPSKQCRLFDVIGTVSRLCSMGPQSYKIEFSRPYSIIM
jgi:hypothetical protein